MKAPGAQAAASCGCGLPRVTPLLLVALLAALVACGQKGSLYLPQKGKPVPAQSPASAPPPATPQSPPSSQHPTPPPETPAPGQTPQTTPQPPDAQAPAQPPPDDQGS